MSEPESAALLARWEIVNAHRCTACGFLSRSAFEITEHLRIHNEPRLPPPEARCGWCGEDVRRDDRGVFGKTTNLRCQASPDGNHGWQPKEGSSDV